MDTDEGEDETPLSLHKYLYAEADPIDNLDPSGNDIADIGALSVGVTLDAMPQLQALTALSSVIATLEGVKVCSRPLTQLKHFHHTYIKILDPHGLYGVNAQHYHTYGVIGLNHTKKDQEVRKDNFAEDQNSGNESVDNCTACATSQQQRDSLVKQLEHWTTNPPCPSCGANYQSYFFPDLVSVFTYKPDGYNSNTFTYNMLSQNPAGRIDPPAESAAPGYHDAPGGWYH